MQFRRPVDNIDCSLCPSQSGIFKVLNKKELQLVSENTIRISYKEGEVILKQGTQMSNVLSVNSGLVKVYLEGDSRKTILRIVKPTSFVGGPGIYYDQLHHYSVSALRNTTVCFIDLPVFKNLLDTNQAFLAAFMKDFSLTVIHNYNRLLSLSQKQLAGRFADAILYLLDEVFGIQEKNINISKDDLGALAAVSRESSNKIIRQFRQEGIIKYSGKNLELLNVEMLRMISKLG